MVPASKARTRAKGIDMLYDYVNTFMDVQDLSVVYSTTPDEAQVLADRIEVPCLTGAGSGWLG